MGTLPTICGYSAQCGRNVQPTMIAQRKQCALNANNVVLVRTIWLLYLSPNINLHMIQDIVKMIVVDLIYVIF